MPSVDEQLQVLAELEAGTKSLMCAITTTEREISLLQEFRTRLIAEVVTGKLDVRGVSRYLPKEADESGEPDESDVIDDSNGPGEILPEEES